MSFNPHPPLTGFPFVILTLAVIFRLFELILRSERWSLLARSLLPFLVIFSIATYYSGYWGLTYANNSSAEFEKAVAAHQTNAKIYLFSLVPLILFSYLETVGGTKTRLWKGLSLLFLMVSWWLAISTSFRGGSLVFDLGAGVRI